MTDADAADNGVGESNGHEPFGNSYAEETTRITLRVPNPLLEEFERAVDADHFASRSAAVRAAMRWFARIELQDQPDGGRHG